MEYIYYVEANPNDSMSSTQHCRSFQEALKWADNLRDNYDISDPGIFRVFLRNGSICIERYINGCWYAPVYDAETCSWEYCTKVTT